MTRKSYGALFLLVCSAVFCVSLAAQATKTITIRMLDSRTGKLIATSDYLVRINHEKTVHGDWVVQNENGSGKLTLPADATEVMIRATYDLATLTYVNCDTNKDRGSSERAASLDHWYSVADILKLGVVAPNGCVGKKVPDKLQVVANPGEFVFFVRKPNAMEQIN
jgi:hypothetical protein